MIKPAPLLPHYTYEDYRHWEGRWEIIDGIPFAMSPMPTPRHQQIAVRLSTEFSIKLEACGACQVYQPLDYLIAEDIVVQPDMLVVCKPIIKKYLDFAPVLVAEILSPSTSEKDRNRKFELYEAEKIPWYLIISPTDEYVEVYTLDGSSYVLHAKGKSMKFDFSSEYCTSKIDLGKLW